MLKLVTAKKLRGFLVSFLFLIPILAHAQKPGSFYWGDSDMDGIISGNDYATLVSVYMDNTQDDADLYFGYPQSRYRQDLDGDGLISGADISFLESWFVGDWNTYGAPTTLEWAGPVAGLTVGNSPGDSVEISAVSYSSAGAGHWPRTGFGIIFAIDPTSECASTVQLYGYNPPGGSTEKAWRNPAAYDYQPTLVNPELGIAAVKVRGVGCTPGSIIRLTAYIPGDMEYLIPGQRLPARLTVSPTPIGITVGGTPPTCETVAIDPASATIPELGSAQFRAVCSMSDSTTVDCTAAATFGVTGDLTLGPKTATQEVIADHIPGEAGGSGMVTANNAACVTPTATPASATVTNDEIVSSLAVNPNPATLNGGETISFTATCTLSDSSTANCTDSLMETPTLWTFTGALTQLTPPNLFQGNQEGGTATVTATYDDGINPPASDSSPVTITDAPPETIITSTPPNPSNDPVPSFEFTCNEPSCTYECKLDTEAWISCSSPFLTYPEYWIATTTGAPVARYFHTAVWTGSEMIVWGGYNGSYQNTGGRYNPLTDTWTATSTTNAPVARTYHTAVWTGEEMIVWGGFSGSLQNTGGRYNPLTDTWTATGTTNAPVARAYHTAVWTGTRMIVWGGQDSGGARNTGGQYNPTNNTWTATSTGANVPQARWWPGSVWTGSEMIIWGGYGGSSTLNTGSKYNPLTDTWTVVTTTNAPSARDKQANVWTGSEMLVWGGDAGGSVRLNTGGRYNPVTDSWSTITTAGAPSARWQPAAVWTGEEMIIWGGDCSPLENTGGNYDPSLDAWVPTIAANAPSARTNFGAVWTGTALIVWGGYSSGYLADGGVYRIGGDLEEGDHTFSVRAYDAALNVDPTPATYTWTIDMTAPDTSLTSFPDNPTNLTEADFTFVCNEPDCTFECRLDSGAWSSCSSPQHFDGLSEASHNFQVRSMDAAGNTDPSPAIYTWVIDVSPPETFINSYPADPTNLDSAIFGLGSSEPDSSFECNLDYSGWEPCSSPVTYSLLLEGMHNFQVRATDLVGNTDPTPASYTWTIDTIPPETNITSAPPDPSGNNFATFTFSCNEAGCTFQCNLDSGGWLACSSPVDYIALTEGAHNFQVRATDPANNTDPSPAVYNWTISANPPDTSITSMPANPSNSSSANLEFICSTPPCTFQCRLDGESWSACASPKNYSGLSDGSHNFQVRAIDAQNNIDPSPASYTWTIDFTPPDTQITSQPPNPSAQPDAAFTFSCTEPTCTFECQLDGGGFEACTSPKTYTSLVDGSYTFEVRAQDIAGNLDPTPASYTWTIDATPPDTNIITYPPDPDNASVVNFTFNCTEPSCTYECKLDSEAWESCVSPKPYGAANAWTPTSISNAPTARYYHTAVWTGSEMIVWGGYNGSPLNTGGKYNPATDSWLSTSTSGAPAGRRFHTAVWAESAMIVWGGYTSSVITNTGGRYDPPTNSWTATSTVNAPAGAYYHSAVWTGSRMIVWGGRDSSANAVNTGGQYNPSDNSWTATSTGANVPQARWWPGSAWTGTEMIIWGGYSGSLTLNTGAKFNPLTDTWTAITNTGAPSPRDKHVMLWTGSEILIWGGDHGGGIALNSGRKYNSVLDSWSAITTTGAPSARWQPAAVWTGSEMIIWGGNCSPLENTGGKYDPALDAWYPTTTFNAPSARTNFGAVWTGAAMIVWGGYNGSYLDTGGIYEGDPLPEGNHTFSVRAYDTALNVDPTPATYAWTIDRTAPDTSLTSFPDNPTNLTEADFAFLCNEPSCTFECQLDSEAWSSCSSPQHYDGLSEASHNFQVRSMDAAGNTDPSPSSYTWVIDITPPDTFINSYPADPTNLDSAIFELGSSEPGSSFECNLDAGGWEPCESPGTYNLLLEGPHNFQARAIDIVGNIDPTPAEWSWTIDLTPPETNITSAPPDPSSNNFATFTFNCDEPGCTFQCNLDSGGWLACSSPVDYFALAEGAHNFQVRATDPVGNIEPVPASYSWTISANPPDTTITSQPDNPTIQTGATFSFTCTKAPCTFECQIDGGGFGSCASPKGYTGLLEGSHTFDVRAIDGFGNVDPTPASYTWTIDFTPPDTQITSQPPNPSNQPDAVFNFTCTEAPCTFECRLDGGGFETCTSPKAYTSLVDGSHTFEVRAQDLAGNLDPTPAAYTWTIDATPPDTTITSAPPDPSGNNFASFTFNCNEPGCTFECNLDGGGWLACSSPVDYSLADGAHNFQVRAIDPANNTDPVPAAYSWTISCNPPDTIITSNPPNPSNFPDATFTFTCNKLPCTYECQIDSEAWESCASPKSYASGGSELWTPTSLTNPPGPRTNHTAVWTGSLMIVWGGYNGSYLNTGGRYDLATDSWTPTSTASAPSGRRYHVTVWTGSEMIVWGGNGYINTGGRYNPATDSWTATSLTNVPEARCYHTGVWAGTRMIVWGGRNSSLAALNSGGQYNPSDDTWTATSTGTNVPQARWWPRAVWTGTEMIVWGGWNGSSVVNTGGRYDPLADSWAQVTVTNAPSARQQATMVWTGSEMLIWGGDGVGSGGLPLNTGGRYDPLTNSWVAITNTGAPSARIEPVLVWTGTEMIVWGGSPSTDTGAKYDPLADSWVATSLTNAPSARRDMAGVWTGDKMIVWGGYDSAYANTGGIYETSGLAEGEHNFSVRAYDAGMNVDPTPAVYDWTIDLTHPETSITSSPDDPSGFSDASFGFTCNEPGSSFECKLDTGAWTACSSLATYTSLSDGSHTFQVRATDAAGNLDLTPASYTWTIDITPPETSINSGPFNPTNLTSAQFFFSSNEPGSFECNLDSAGWEPCSSPTTYDLLLEGPHYFQVRAIDTLGNIDPTPAEWYWIIDLTPPETTITSAPPDPSSNNFATFTFSCSEPECTFECNLDSAGWSACPSPVEYIALANGAHNFLVRAIDMAGNTDPVPASYNWTVNAIPPDTTITSMPPDPSASNNASFEFTCSDPPCTYECRLDGAGFSACSSPKSYSGLIDGLHTFEVRSRDAAGNTDTTPASYTWVVDSPLDTILLSYPPDPTSSPAEFTFTCTILPCTYECSLDLAAWESCTSPKSYALAESWTPTSLTNAPSARSSHTAVWTGTVMIAWGGGVGYQNTGGRYDPASDSWTATSLTNAPEGRCYHTAVWTGTEMIVWGGYYYLGYSVYQFLDTGGRYNPATNSWTATSTTNAADPRIYHTAVWTGTEMIVWGGYFIEYGGELDSGGRYNPASDSWTATTLTNAPAARSNHTAVWAASKMIVWGGCTYFNFEYGFCSTAINTGGRYEPASDSWTATSGTNAPAPRASHTAVWTGTVMIAWGGGVGYQNTGGRYDPASDSWTVTSLTNAPAARWAHTAAWAGNEMIIWGGDGGGYQNTGGRYNPATNSWTATSTSANVPSARAYHTAVWTGTEMIVWGGAPSTNTGGIYEYHEDGLAPGEHTFSVRAYDAELNIDPTPAVYTWTIDQTAPDTTITSGPVECTSDTYAEFTFTCNEPSCTFECNLDSAGWEACPSPKTYSGLLSGSHNFQVLAIDAAGNPDPTPASYTWFVNDDSYEPNDTQAAAYDLSPYLIGCLSDLQGPAIANNDDWFYNYCDNYHWLYVIFLVSDDTDGELDLCVNGTCSRNPGNNESYYVPDRGDYYIQVELMSGSNVYYDLCWY